jgi:hypothetical protein
MRLLGCVGLVALIAAAFNQYCGCLVLELTG